MRRCASKRFSIQFPFFLKNRSCERKKMHTLGVRHGTDEWRYSWKLSNFYVTNNFQVLKSVQLRKSTLTLGG